MRTGARSFATYSAFVIPSVILAAMVIGSPNVLWGLAGLFFVLKFCNQLDATTIRNEQSK